MARIVVPCRKRLLWQKRGRPTASLQRGKGSVWSCYNLKSGAVAVEGHDTSGGRKPLLSPSSEVDAATRLSVLIDVRITAALRLVAWFGF